MTNKKTTKKATAKKTTENVEVKRPVVVAKPAISITKFNKVSKALTSAENTIINQKDEITALSVNVKSAKALNEELVDLLNMILNVIPEQKKPWYFWLMNGWSLVKQILTLIKDFKIFKEENGEVEVQSLVGKINV